jgi:hypothetical protein
VINCRGLVVHRNFLRVRPLVCSTDFTQMPIAADSRALGLRPYLLAGSFARTVLMHRQSLSLHLLLLGIECLQLRDKLFMLQRQKKRCPPVLI